jgi:hypothetical protein
MDGLEKSKERVTQKALFRPMPDGHLSEPPDRSEATSSLIADAQIVDCEFDYETPEFPMLLD